ncbi:hypothetical protein [Streptomyces sp. NBC_00162]|uniref:hypothetical protein n=1 Tax=Streptomyces sp. NBC_00162 TaxID=2903629 RepID=UPI00214BD1A8|nr:hypothetical protein [Streptomyces sp. NBC_00162]UUU45124.1 hypothetical protein JIW86_41015 [Streptomyces sp. NBC_00162]
MSVAFLASTSGLIYTLTTSPTPGTAAPAPAGPTTAGTSSPFKTPVPARTEPPSPKPSVSAEFTIGQEARHMGTVVTVKTVTETDNLKTTEGTQKAGDGAKFVTVQTKVFNDTKEGMDLTCSLPVVNKLLDEQQRRYDAIQDLYEIPGNPGCNDQLQPGFSDDMTYIYRVPATAKITGWEFEQLDLGGPPRLPALVKLTSGTNSASS